MGGEAWTAGKSVASLGHMDEQRCVQASAVRVYCSGVVGIEDIGFQKFPAP